MSRYLQVAHWFWDTTIYIKQDFNSFMKEVYAMGLDSLYIFICKISNMEVSTMLKELKKSVFEIPQLHNRFNEYLAILADNKFGSLLVC